MWMRIVISSVLALVLLPAMMFAFNEKPKFSNRIPAATATAMDSKLDNPVSDAVATQATAKTNLNTQKNRIAGVVCVKCAAEDVDASLNERLRFSNHNGKSALRVEVATGERVGHVWLMEPYDYTAPMLASLPDGDIKACVTAFGVALEE
jgi:hypothetical protein